VGAEHGRRPAGFQGRSGKFSPGGVEAAAGYITYSAELELSVWVRRRVRLYYWKQWKQPRTRRRHLLALGADPERVHMATRSRKGYWRMSQNEIVRFALNNRWLEEQGVPDMRITWTVLYYGPEARV